MLPRNLILAVTVACMALPTCVQGQAPIYQPYGAWRGRIRYVEGPRRVRTHVRWGGGLTPVGGQVLMHLGTVAGNVASDYLGAGTGREAELDPELVRINAMVSAENATLRKGVNEVLAKLNLPLVPEPPVELPVAPVVPVPDGGTSAINPQLVLQQLHAAWDKLNRLRRKLAGEVQAAILIGDQLGDELSADQKNRLDELKNNVANLTVVSKVTTPDKIEIAEPTAEDFGNLLKSIDDTIRQLNGPLNDTKTLAMKILEDRSSDPGGTIAGLVTELSTFIREVTARE